MRYGVRKNINGERYDKFLILLTNRTHKLKKEIIFLLKEKGITFDYHLFRKNDRSKANRLSDFIDNFEHSDKIKEVSFWDDKDKHIDDVSKLTKNYKSIKFQLNKVK